MAVSIDTVYQRVLNIANKEQRGYITPQEFNLMANKAQLEIFDSYFHDLKTAYHKVKNDIRLINLTMIYCVHLLGAADPCNPDPCNVANGEVCDAGN